MSQNLFIVHSVTKDINNSFNASVLCPLSSDLFCLIAMNIIGKIQLILSHSCINAQYYSLIVSLSKTFITIALSALVFMYLLYQRTMILLELDCLYFSCNNVVGRSPVL